MTTFNTELFHKYTLESNKPVLVEFSAPWCVYCRRINPAMERLAKQYEDRLLMAQINIDEEPDLAQQEMIELVPTLLIYRGGEVLGSIVAPESKAAIEDFIKETLKF